LDPLGEITALPRSTSWIKGEGVCIRVRGGREKGKERERVGVICSITSCGIDAPVYCNNYPLSKILRSDRMVSKTIFDW